MTKISDSLETRGRGPRSEMQNARAATDLDRHVGERLRLARGLARLSQSEIGARVGVTFQQIQKYERGANRVSASRLYEFARVLDKPISYFFPDTESSPPEDGILQPLKRLNPHDAARALAALDSCDAKTRAHLLSLIGIIGAPEPAAKAPR